MDVIRNLANFGKSFMAQHNCQYCHQEATHYVMYKDFYSYLCNKKECSHIFDVKAGIFKTNFEIETKGV